LFKCAKSGDQKVTESFKSTSPVSPVSRRKLFGGATSLGAIAATAALLPGIRATAPASTEVKAPPAKGGGYTLSEHVKQYYKSALI
jgi:hypothetical protein